MLCGLAGWVNAAARTSWWRPAHAVASAGTSATAPQGAQFAQQNCPAVLELGPGGAGLGLDSAPSWAA